MDFEKRIAAIYQRCRKPEEIQAAFDQLQLELSLEINDVHDPHAPASCWRTSTTRCARSSGCATRTPRPTSTGIERLLMQLTRHELDGHAEFRGRFVVPAESRSPFPDRRPRSPSVSTSCRAAPVKPTFTA
ncbi:MAG: hypothetical protein M0C28_06465 [Candidatus Moduliflexus flocculans]|nr:hypothetical protein [Candidatus Moduliflexus flocculans]